MYYQKCLTVALFETYIPRRSGRLSGPFLTTVLRSAFSVENLNRQLFPISNETVLLHPCIPDKFSTLEAYFAAQMPPQDRCGEMHGKASTSQFCFDAHFKVFQVEQSPFSVRGKFRFRSAHGRSLPASRSPQSLPISRPPQKQASADSTLAARDLNLHLGPILQETSSPSKKSAQPCSQASVASWHQCASLALLAASILLEFSTVDSKGLVTWKLASVHKFLCI